MIEHVSEKFLFLFQFVYIIWPLFILTALAYSFQFSFKRGWTRGLGRRLHDNLFLTWLILFGIWLVTLFAREPIPSLIPEPANTLIFFGGLTLLAVLQALRLRKIPLRLKARFDLHEAENIEYLNNLEPDEFEELAAETYRALGNKAWRVGKSGDHGVDVEVRSPKGERWIVQCKRYRTPVGERIVRELYGALMNEGAERAVLVTSNEISQAARTWARDKPIDLVDGPALLWLADKARRKIQGSPFDRLAEWLRSLFQPDHPPAGLRGTEGNTPPAAIYLVSKQSNPPSPSDDVDPTQPIRVRQSNPNTETAMLHEVHHTAPARSCPRCGAPLASHPGHPGRNLYRCTRYPQCRVVLER